MDYNAGYTMALAAAIELPRSFWTSKCGGARLPRFALGCSCIDTLPRWVTTVASHVTAAGGGMQG